MTEHQCQCGKPAPTTTICAECTTRLRRDLRSLYTRDHGTSYADDLDLALSRQVRFADRADGSRSTSTPVVFNERASDVGLHLQAILTGWTRVLAEDGNDWPTHTLQAMAEWLHTHVHHLARHEAAGDAYDELTTAVAQVRSAIDRPPELVYAGPCLVVYDQGECRADVYARPGRPYAVCQRCGASHDVAERREQLAEAMEEEQVTASRAVIYLRMLGFTVTASAIRGYAHYDGKRPEHERRLQAVGHSVRGAVYRLGDILDIVSSRGRVKQEVAS